MKDTYNIGSKPYESVDNSLLSAFQHGQDGEYVEEDSYINPSNVSKVNQSVVQQPFNLNELNSNVNISLLSIEQ